MQCCVPSSSFRIPEVHKVATGLWEVGCVLLACCNSGVPPRSVGEDPADSLVKQHQRAIYQSEQYRIIPEDYLCLLEQMNYLLRTVQQISPPASCPTPGFFIRVMFFPLYALRNIPKTWLFPFLSSSAAKASTAILKAFSSPEQCAVIILTINSAFMVY